MTKRSFKELFRACGAWLLLLAGAVASRGQPSRLEAIEATPPTAPCSPAHALTAGAGGIRSIRAWTDADGALRYEIDGEVLAPLEQSPRFNRRDNVLPPAADVGLPQCYQRAHLWGPGFGDEAAAGIFYAPRAMNLAWQNAGVEAFLRELRPIAAEQGAALMLRVAARSHPWSADHERSWPKARGRLLAEVEYRFHLAWPCGETTPSHVVSLEVGLPPEGRVTVCCALAVMQAPLGR